MFSKLCMKFPVAGSFFSALARIVPSTLVQHPLLLCHCHIGHLSCGCFAFFATMCLGRECLFIHPLSDLRRYIWKILSTASSLAVAASYPKSRGQVFLRILAVIVSSCGRCDLGHFFAASNFLIPSPAASNCRSLNIHSGWKGGPHSLISGTWECDFIRNKSSE